MCFFDFGIVMFGGSTREDCRCEATLERIEPFFALATKPLRSFVVAVFGAKMDI